MASLLEIRDEIERLKSNGKTKSFKEENNL